jgi:hypothetical protein
VAFVVDFFFERMAGVLPIIKQAKKTKGNYNLSDTNSKTQHNRWGTEKTKDKQTQLPRDTNAKAKRKPA